METGNFVDFLSTFWQILRFPFGLFLVFSCFFPVAVILRVVVRIATSRGVVEVRGLYDFLLQFVEHLVIEGFVQPTAQETIFPVVGVSSVRDTRRIVVRSI